MSEGTTNLIKLLISIGVKTVGKVGAVLLLVAAIVALSGGILVVGTTTIISMHT